MAAAEEQSSLSELEVSSLSESSESIDFSCIHWGYLNCTLVTEQGKKGKDLIWHTYWVDLCCSTIRLYRDLSLPSDSADSPPPSSVLGPSNENEKKQAFLMLKKGATVAICDYEEEFRSRKRSGKDMYNGVLTRNNVFKLAVAPSIPNSPVYLFQAPSKGSMYRWISKIMEGIENADQPQNQSASAPSVFNSAVNFLRGIAIYKKLKEAKLAAMEQRRYHVPPELRYPENDDSDSLLEADVDENFTYERPPPNPKLERLKEQLKRATELLNQLEKEEESFMGGKETCRLAKACRFEATTKRDYFLVPGHKVTLVRKGSKLTIFGQLPNERWRCCVEVRSENQINEENSEASTWEQRNNVQCSNSEHQGIIQKHVGSTSIGNENKTSAPNTTRILIGSVPTSLLVELGREDPLSLVGEEGTPPDSPVESEELPTYPSPPSSPYSKHRSTSSVTGSDRSYGERPSPRASRKFIPDEEATWVVDFPMSSSFSCQSSATTSRSTTPSDSPGGSINGSAERLDNLETKELNERNRNLQDIPNASKNDNCETSSISESSDIPVTYIGSETEDDREITVIDLSSSPLSTPKVNPRIRSLKSEEKSLGSSHLSSSPENYSFQVTRKLRQRGISLIVGSSSSEDEDDEQDKNAGSPTSKLSYRQLDKEFQKFEAKEQSVRPFSSRKRASINLGPRTANFPRRCALNDSLLSEYSSQSKTLNGKMNRSRTCPSIRNLNLTGSLENSPPLNQKRLLQMRKALGGGYGFTLQTYGIVQSAGEVDYTTFVLAIEEDGPAYMAGLRPGDIIVEIEGEPVNGADHKTIVSRIQQAPVTVRLTAVFVDAIRKMKLNTEIKLLKAELKNKERQLEKLIKKEAEILKGRKIDLEDLDKVDGLESTFLFTTEMTSAFASDSPIVHDSLYEYKQKPGDNKPRRVSLPHPLRGTMVATTGTQLLKNFATLPANFAKHASTKLQKSVKKRTSVSNTFKSYLDLDEPSSSQESLSAESSFLDQSPEKVKNTHRSMDSLAPKRSGKQERPRSLPEDLSIPFYSTTDSAATSSNKIELTVKQGEYDSTQNNPWVRRDELPEVAVRPPTPSSSVEHLHESTPLLDPECTVVPCNDYTQPVVLNSHQEVTNKTKTKVKSIAGKSEDSESPSSECTPLLGSHAPSETSETFCCSAEKEKQPVVKTKIVITEVVVHSRAAVPDSTVSQTKSKEKQHRNDSPSRISDMRGKFENPGRWTPPVQRKCDPSKSVAGKTESQSNGNKGGAVGKVSHILGRFEGRSSESTNGDKRNVVDSPSKVVVLMDNIEVKTHNKRPPPVFPKPKLNFESKSGSQNLETRPTAHQTSQLNTGHSGAGSPESYVKTLNSTRTSSPFHQNSS